MEIHVKECGLSGNVAGEGLNILSRIALLGPSAS
jgi:hypothetical protein